MLTRDDGGARLGARTTPPASRCRVPTPWAIACARRAAWRRRIRASPRPWRSTRAW